MSTALLGIAYAFVLAEMIVLNQELVEHSSLLSMVHVLYTDRDKGCQLTALHRLDLFFDSFEASFFSFLRVD